MPSLDGLLPEVPCVKCGRRVRGLPWGELCPDCRAERQRHASKLAGRIAPAATIVAAVYVALSIPSTTTARYYGVLAVAVTYILVRRIAQRVAMEVMK